MCVGGVSVSVRTEILGRTQVSLQTELLVSAPPEGAEQNIFKVLNIRRVE